MTSSPSTVPAFLDALYTQLVARPGMAGVQVATGPMLEDSTEESVQFPRVEANQIFANIGKFAREETYLCHGWVWIEKYGAGEKIIQAGRARAYAILAEIEAQLRTDPSVNDTVRVAEYDGCDLSMGVTAAGSRWTQLDFKIKVAARLG